MPTITPLPTAPARSMDPDTFISTMDAWIAALATFNTELNAFETGLVSGLAFRNKIIGGDFTTNPWQRGTTFTGLASNGFGPDRWFLTNGSSGVADWLKAADAPTAAQAGVYATHCLHVDVTTADASIAATDSYYIRQHIEGYNAACLGFGQAGTRYVTLSFWVKATKTGTYCVSLRNSSANRSYVAEYTVSASDTWEFKEITIPVDTSGTWLYDSGIGVGLSFALAAGSNFHTTAGAWAAGNYTATSNQVNALDSTSNNFKLALVQLEAGSDATSFETRGYGQELALCQRYYYRVQPGVNGAVLSQEGYASSATAFLSGNQFPVPMRTAPSALEQSGTAADYRVVGAGAASTVCSSVPAFFSATAEFARTTFTVAAGLTAYAAGVGANGAAVSTSYLAWSAEL